MGTSDTAIYGYGGFLVDVFFGRRFVLTPALALDTMRTVMAVTSVMDWNFVHRLNSLTGLITELV